MRTTIDISDVLLKNAKKKAIEEGITLKQYFTQLLEKDLLESPSNKSTPWKKLQGMGSAKSLNPNDSGFERYSGPDWNHSKQVNEPKK